MGQPCRPHWQRERIGGSGGWGMVVLRSSGLWRRLWGGWSGQLGLRGNGFVSRWVEETQCLGSLPSKALPWLRRRLPWLQRRELPSL